MAVNLFALLMFAGGVLYLDKFRERLVEQRSEQLLTQARLVADSIAEQPANSQTNSIMAGKLLRFARTVARETPVRVRLLDPQGQLLLDSLQLLDMPDPLVDLRERTVQRQLAEMLDKLIELVGGFPKLEAYSDITGKPLASLPEVADALQGADGIQLRRLEDGTVTINVAAPISIASASTSAETLVGAVLLTAGTRDIRSVVRAERLTYFQIFLFVLGLSLLLSFFLARTIARPIRRLALAAERVRLGRAREVAIPQFTARTDEIGMLSRTLTDMTHALYTRMDAIESFAADVSHELKNPLSSVRSAVESLQRTADPALQAQLLRLISEDVRRLDRLISDISDASRLDAELSRARFEQVDLGELIGTLTEVESAGRAAEGQVALSFTRPPAASSIVLGLESRLSQVVRNLVDNAISFSPPGGTVAISMRNRLGHVEVSVSDEGPGVPEENRHDIFKRFYSERPDSEAFGRHSGLGLAICKQIVEAHGGQISVENRPLPARISADPDRTSGGARFTILLPLAGTGATGDDTTRRPDLQA